MGSIPLKGGIIIREPAQDAIIVWNGKEQLLYLKTTLSASENTRVLEVMPLPSKPSVAASDRGVFKRCGFLLPQPPKIDADAAGDSPFGAEPLAAAGRVVETKQIGVHSLKTVELLDAGRFKAWVEGEFRDTTDGVTIPPKLLEVIDEYASDGYRWFLFDTISLTTKASTKTPLRIRFATDKLYYPMRITRTESGHTKVSLSILTNVLFEKEDCLGIPRDQIRVPARSRTIPGDKLHWIDPPIFQLLGRPANAKLRSWIIEGPIDGFEQDLLIGHPERRAAPSRSR